MTEIRDNPFSEEFTKTLLENIQKQSSNRYSLCENTIGIDEISAAVKVMGSLRFTMGENVKRFEKEFAKKLGAKHAVMVNSGSSANLLGIAAMVYRSENALKAGDEVLVPSLAWPTTVWPLAQLGLKPVYVDINNSDLSVCLESCKNALTQKTKALFMIHVLGAPADMTQINKFCSENRLTLLEDCCESLGASWNGTHVGNFGEFGTFSFYFSHHMTTIEGGMITTNSDQTADDLLSLRAHGWTRDRSDRAQLRQTYSQIDDRFLFVLPGFNLRPMELQAAIGLVQLEKLDAMLEGRIQNAKKIIDTILVSKSPCHPVSQTKQGGVHSWMAIPFVINDGVNRSDFCTVLEENGVETRPIIAGNLSKHPANKWIDTAVPGPTPNSDRLWAQGFMIGCHPHMTSKQLETLKNAFLKTAALGKIQ